MNTEIYPFTWVRVKLKGKRKAFWLGFCGKTRHAVKMATDFLSPLVVQDFYIDRDVCEEGGRCFYFECPYNRATQSSLHHEYQQAHKKIDMMNIKLGEIELGDDIKGGHGGVVMTKDGGPVWELS